MKVPPNALLVFVSLCELTREDRIEVGISVETDFVVAHEGEPTHAVQIGDDPGHLSADGGHGSAVQLEHQNSHFGVFVGVCSPAVIDLRLDYWTASEDYVMDVCVRVGIGGGTLAGDV